MLDKLIHKYLRVPYTLNIRHKKIVKDSATTYLFIHGIGDTGDMWINILKKMPTNASYIVVDLLGFGQSPTPAWVKYDAKAQARSLLTTYVGLGLHTQVVVVGHSLGALVAVEFAKRYRVLTKQIVLCSPPIYEKPTDTRSFSKQDALRWIYHQISENPKALVDAYGLGEKLGLLNPHPGIHEDNVDMFVKSLKSSIINQTTIDDIAKIKVPIMVIYGVFDPLIVSSTLRKIGRNRPNITIQTIPDGHLISKNYRKQLLKILAQFI